MSNFAAVLDANVLYSYPLTSVLLELAEMRLFRPIWSEEIHAEWMRNLRKNRPDIDPDKIERRRRLMDKALPDARVTGHEMLMPALDGLDLPDPDDRHVIAAAIRGKAQVIVTFNERDFPAEVLGVFDICAQHPDTFLRHLIDLAPIPVLHRVTTMVGEYTNPPTAVADFISSLERQSLPESAAALRDLLSDGL
jgi:hypothetical protein